MQCINIISISGGKPVIYVPLSAIVAITAIKDLFEDLKRHRSDNEENNRKVMVFRNGMFMEAPWKDLKVGEIIKVFHKLLKIVKNFGKLPKVKKRPILSSGRTGSVFKRTEGIVLH